MKKILLLLQYFISNQLNSKNMAVKKKVAKKAAPKKKVAKKVAKKKK